MQSLGNYATQSVTYVSGTSVTHLSGLYTLKGGEGGIWDPKQNLFGHLKLELGAYLGFGICHLEFL